MINTVLFKKDFEIGCHAVGILDCLRIDEIKHESNDDFDSYSYEAIYPDRLIKITDVILATDIKLT